MEHSIIFSIFGFVFGLMLLFTIIFKKRKNNVKTKLYTILIIISMAYAIVDVINLVSLVFYGKDSELVRLVWNVRSGFLYIFILLYGWYIYVVMNKIELEKLSEFLKKKTNIFLMIFIGICVILSLIGGKFPGFTIDNLDFTGGRGFVTAIALPLIGTIVAFVFSIKYRKTRKNIFNTMLLILIILVTSIIFQVSFKYISIFPFIFILINFLVYYNIENPDIELLDEVLTLKDKIDKSSSAKTDFLFNLSHDLINPINSIVSLSQTLKGLSVNDSDDVNKYLKNIKYAGNTLLDSIDNVLDFSDIDGDENKSSNIEFSLYEMLKKIETVAVSRIGSKNVKFEIDVDDNISAKLIGDVVKLQKILLNIVSNACKYTDVGKVNLKVNYTEDKDSYVLHFVIQDTGCGIKEDKINFIFEDEQDTSGIGLALSKKYIEIMIGTITVKSVYGAGTTFFVNIPLKKTGLKLVSEDKSTTVSDGKIEFIDCSQYKVLICDDHILDLKVTRKLLDKYNFQITCISDSSECISKIKVGETYDLLLLDHKMPGMDGLNVVKALRSLEEYELPKIIAFTANAIAGARDYYVNSGFDDYLSKPIDIYELDRIINKYFKK